MKKVNVVVDFKSRGRSFYKGEVREGVGEHRSMAGAAPAPVGSSQRRAVHGRADV